MHNFSVFQWVHVSTYQGLCLFLFGCPFPSPSPSLSPWRGVTKVVLVVFVVAALVILYTIIWQYTHLVALLCTWHIKHSYSYRYRLQYLHNACIMYMYLRRLRRCHLWFSWSASCLFPLRRLVQSQPLAHLSIVEVNSSVCTQHTKASTALQFYLMHM